MRATFGTGNTDQVTVIVAVMVRVEVAVVGERAGLVERDRRRAARVDRPGVEGTIVGRRRVCCGVVVGERHGGAGGNGQLGGTEGEVLDRRRVRAGAAGADAGRSRCRCGCRCAAGADAGAEAGADAGAAEAAAGGAGIGPVVPSIGVHSAAGAADPAVVAAGSLAAGTLASVIAASRRTMAPLPSLAPIAGVDT